MSKRDYIMEKNKIKKMINVMIEIIKIMFQYKKWFFILMLFLNLVLAVIPYVSIIISQNLINIIQIRNKSMYTLLFIGILYIAIKIFNALLTSLNSYLSQYYSEYLFLNLNKLFLDKCNQLNYDDFENSETYDKLQRAEQNIGVRTLSLVNNLVTLFSNLIGFIISLIILSKWHSWSLIGFIILPIISFKYFISINEFEQKVVRSRTNVERKSWYLTFLMIKDYYIKEVKIYHLTNYLMNKYVKLKNIIFKQNISIAKKKSMFSFVYKLSNTLFSSIIIINALIETYLGKILVGNFMTYINTTSMIESNISNTVSTILAIYSDCLYCDYILEFFEIADSRIQNKKELQKIDKIDCIELKNVSFKYPNREAYALKDFSFKFTANKIYSIVGENGSGKSTLIKLLTGLYENYTGDIYINGINLKLIDKNYLSDQMGVIFQDFNQYEFSVNENINVGDINTSDCEKIKAVSKISGADKFILKLPRKYDQQLGNWFENGIQLSGGQWQKIAVSRALMRNVGCYILDEPTASLDPSSEYSFYNNFKKNINNSIGILVTHRFTNAKMSDEIIVMADGMLVEQGTHAKLMENKNTYYQLYMLQLGGIQ